MTLINARSLSNKIDMINDFVDTNSIDILAITETWLQKDDRALISQLERNSFNFNHTPRSSSASGKGRGGGVALIVKKFIKLTKQQHHTESHSSGEFLHCCFSSDSTHFEIMVIYRSPSYHISPFINEFSEFISDIHTDNTIIVGDFNIHVNNNNHDTTTFFETLDSYSLIQHCDFSTHNQGNTLDLVITKSHKPLFISKPTKSTLITDHYAINFNLMTKRPPPRPRKMITFRPTSTVGTDSFVDHFTTLVLNSHSPTPDFDTLNNCLVEMINTLSPMKTISIPDHPTSPWFTAELRIYKRFLRNLEHTMSKFNNTLNKNNYTKARNIYTNKIRYTKCSYYLKLLSNPDLSSKEMFKITNSLLGRTVVNKLPDLPDTDLPEIFASFFENKVSNLISTLPITSPSYNQLPNGSSIPNIDQFLPPTISDLSSLLKSSKKSSPNDPIPFEVFRRISPHLINYIHFAISQSFATGFVPLTLKQAFITPILKKPTLDPDSLANYRPISQLPLLSKILEKIVAKQLNTFITTHSILNDHRSAYLHGKSTETALTLISNDILVSLDSDKITLLTLLDMSAAFDTLHHGKLITRLEYIGITGLALNWIKSFISDRSYCVKTNQNISKPHPLKHGVPQGSVLGPLLFIIFIDPISTICKNHAISYHMYGVHCTQTTYNYIPLVTPPAIYQTSLPH